MGISLILGGNGQDGSFMAEHLAQRDDTVWAVGQQEKQRWPIAGNVVHWHQADLADAAALRRMLDEVRPDRIYHLAAVHGAAGFAYETVWGKALDVNVKALHMALEHARERPGQVRVLYASSCKVYGTPMMGRIGPDTPRIGSCLYSITKVAGHGLADYYRRVHGIPVAVVTLFNHESPRRHSSYFIPQIAAALRAGINGGAMPAVMRTLDFHIDWGCAREYMALAAGLLEHNVPTDVLMATGTVHYGREFVAALFARHGLDWRDHVKETVVGPDGNGLTRSVPFSVDLAQTAGILGRLPQRTIFDVVDDLLALECPS
jgi:GDPmannose 4,6-dehydratase